MFKLNRCIKYVFLSSMSIFLWVLILSKNDLYNNFATYSYVEVQFVKNANEVFVKEFFVSLRDELSYSNDSLTKDVPHCYGTCVPAADYPFNDQSSVLRYLDAKCWTRFFVLENPNSYLFAKERSLSTDVRDSFPCFLHLNKSNIIGANRGVFTKVRIPRGVIFGPYTGAKRKLDGEEGEAAKNGGYAWKIEDEENSFFIDGANVENANWLRYVNSARFAEEQNLYPLQMDKAIYYYVLQDIASGTELLVWYGTTYARNMGIVFNESYNDNAKAFALAPLRSEIKCPSCKDNVI